MLLDAGVAKDKRELYGYGCAAAAGSGCVEIVTMLLEAGADRDMRIGGANQPKSMQLAAATRKFYPR